MVNFHSYVSLPEGNHLITGVPNVSLKIRGVPAAALRPHFVRWNPGKCLSSGLEPCPVSTKVGPWKNRKTKRQSETSFQICFPHVCNCLQSLGTLTSKLQKAQDCVLEVGLLNSPWAVEDFCNSTYQPSLGSLWASQLEDRTIPIRTFSAKTWNERSWKRPQLNAKLTECKQVQCQVMPKVTKINTSLMSVLWCLMYVYIYITSNYMWYIHNTRSIWFYMNISLSIYIYIHVSLANENSGLLLMISRSLNIRNQ